jgi:hypothetical protein
MKLSGYKVGLVLSQAGFSGNQLVFAKQMLKFIAKTLGPGGGGITVTVPGMPHDGADAGARAVERLLAPLQGIDYVRLVIAENVGQPPDCVRLFADHDEVWCVPAERQSRRTKARPLLVYDLGMQLPAEYRKYKLIQPWVEPMVAEARDTKKPKAMKGY